LTEILTETPEFFWLDNMRNIYHEKNIYNQNPECWAEEILHLTDDHYSLSCFLTEIGYSGNVKEKLAQFFCMKVGFK
jgi:hypothetical protein